MYSQIIYISFRPYPTCIFWGLRWELLVLHADYPSQALLSSFSLNTNIHKTWARLIFILTLCFKFELGFLLLILIQFFMRYLNWQHLIYCFSVCRWFITIVCILRIFFWSFFRSQNLFLKQHSSVSWNKIELPLHTLLLQWIKLVSKYYIFHWNLCYQFSTS